MWLVLQSIEKLESEEDNKGQNPWFSIANRMGIPKEILESICQKITAFSQLLDQLRREAAYLPIHELIHRMYLKTGYYDYVSAMPAGKQGKPI